jgi:selenide, water dikinase
VPVLEEAWDLARQEVVPGGTRRNLTAVAPFVDWSERLSSVDQLVLADAQTSGGLLIAVEPSAAQALLDELAARGTRAAARIGTFTDHPGRIEVV